MKNLFGSNPIVEVLKVENDKLLLFTPLEETTYNEIKFAFQHFLSFPKSSFKRDELNKELYRLHKVNFTDIVAIGDTKMETRLANTFIDNRTIKSNELVRRSYKCFVNKNWQQLNVHINAPYHDDGGCSWNCLMQKLHNPTFGIIYNILFEDKKHFNLNGDE